MNQNTNYKVIVFKLFFAAIFKEKNKDFLGLRSAKAILIWLSESLGNP